MADTVKPGLSVEDECKLEQLLAQTQQMHELATGGEWEKVASLEQKRRHLINRGLSLEAKSDNPQTAVNHIRKIIELNKKVITMGQDAQKSLGSTLNDCRRRRQATQAYQKIGS